MAGYIDYDRLPVTELREIAVKLGLSSSGIKTTLIKRIKKHEEEITTIFEEKVAKELQSSTRQSKILHLTSSLIYRYYSNGDIFSKSLENTPELYEELNAADKKWFNDFLFLPRIK